MKGEQMDDLRSFWIVVAEELATRCCTESAALDAKIAESRQRSEGDSFFTITLPAFCKDFEKSLDQGAVTRLLFQGWRKLPSTTGPSVIPQFLGGFMSLIFDRDSGELLEQPDIDAIFSIRQLTLMYGKLLLPATKARVEKAIEGYLECEQEVRRFDAERASSLVEDFREASTILWGTVLQAVDEDIYYHRIIPRHGPGATADRLKGNQKFDQLEWTDRLERVFSWSDFIIPSARYFQEYLPKVNFLEPGAERPVRVITVPKTLKTPRIIAIEPTCMQYVQQGLMAKFVEYIESPFVGSNSNRNVGFGVVGFTDQKPNQLLACEGSLSGDLATLDLSEASDRVSNQLVRTMLENYPNLAEGVDASRSRKAEVRGHGVIRLAKFASMGSALTFPIEAMVFSTIIFIGIARALAEQEGRESRTLVDTDLIMRYRSSVRVYGDDIVVPVRFVQWVVDALESYGFKVNSNKSFWTGKFRESCGKEYYDGHDVSVVRVRRAFPSRPIHGMVCHDNPGPRENSRRSRRPREESSPLGVLRHVDGSGRWYDRLYPIQPWSLSSGRKRGFIQGVQAQAIISAVDLRNQCYMHGMWRSAGFLDGYLQELLTHYPTVSSDSPALGRLSVLGYQAERVDSRLHNFKVRGWKIHTKAPKSKVSGVGALMKCLLNKSEGEIPEDVLGWLMAISGIDEEHLNRSGRPQSVSIKTAWIRPY
nr:MAG: hypothetical protein 3 [Leviviridae sp.]